MSRARWCLVAHGAGGYNMRQLAEELETAGHGPECQGLVLVDALQGEKRVVVERVRGGAQVAGGHGQQWRNGAAAVARGPHPTDQCGAARQDGVQVLYRGAALRRALFAVSGAPRRRSAREPSHSADGAALQGRCCDGHEAVRVPAGVTPQTLADLERKWLDAQTKLAHTVSKRSVHLVVNDASHCIHHEKPDEVTKAVRALVEEIHGEVDEHRGLMSLTKEM
ncbi:hypothetical protein ON010_g11507 [Phytophthora cinnamomi]|nr:hypothetical protein ON010_g11507 [Phytophthora cinnamomi]